MKPKRYSKDIPEVGLDIVLKSAEIANHVTKFGASTERERENSYNFITEQLNLLCLPPHRYRYKTDTVIVVLQIYIFLLHELHQLLCLQSIIMLQDASSSI